MSLMQKWDTHYEKYPPSEPVEACWLLQNHLDQLPLTGKALDLACGLGGNARLMAKCGLTVEAWDISDVALTQLNNWAAVNQYKIQPVLTDIDSMLFPYQQFEVIVISQYLNRALFPQIELALKPGGLLFYQTFLAPIQHQGPKNEAYYLKTAELTQAWPNLTTLIYGEGNPNQQNRLAWYIGQKKT